MTKKDITDAYLWIRKNNNTIPDEVLNFMKESAVKALENINKKPIYKPEEVSVIIDGSWWPTDYEPDYSWEEFQASFPRDVDVILMSPGLKNVGKLEFDFDTWWKMECESYCSSEDTQEYSTGRKYLLDNFDKIKWIK